MGSISAITPKGELNIIDIRSDTAGIKLQQEIRAGLKPAGGGEKTLPTLLLYDEQGLKLFERITYLDEYYLTGEEISVLGKDADSIAGRIPNDALVVELGSGNLRKIKLLLDAFEKAEKTASYYALDVMQSELERTLAEVPKYKFVQCFGLLGTYDDGLSWLQRPEHAGKRKIVLSMGSSMGNFSPETAASFILKIGGALGLQDALLIGLDGCQQSGKVYRAYNDSKSVTHEFTANGLRHANKLLGYEAFRLTDWEATGEYDVKAHRHRAFVTPKKDVVVEGVLVKQGERIQFEESVKYSRAQADQLWRSGCVIETTRWTNQAGDYGLYLLKPVNMFSTKPEQYAKHPVPNLDEWQQLWKVWDVATRQMIPEEELLSKPIKLRNACIFYLGHIPAFLDIKLTEATGGPPTEPRYFYNIFERGIDPDVDNPEQCHSHSEIPDMWPGLDAILAFQENVRQRVTGLYKSGKAYSDNWTGRALWVGYEHEAMHLETLLYMLLQSDWIRPPAVASKPDFKQLAVKSHQESVENEWFDVPAQTISLGIEDPDNGDGPVRYFGWDIEKPVRLAKVGALKAKGRPITNGEYARYMSETGKKEIPASWTTLDAADEINGINGYVNGDSGLRHFVEGKAIRTVYGPVPLKYALDWPVSASYDELSVCAEYMGGRIPTLEEARSIYFYADEIRTREASRVLQKTIPAVNGHLVNDGVEESPPSNRSVNGTNAAVRLDPNELFIDLDQANVGFKHWHPMPVTQNGNKLAGQADMGGLWEWTSSALERQDGFVPMKLYPAYSADFYDGKHNVVLGGSWATLPRVAGRQSFVNWYQRNYLYAWAGARLVKDA